MKHYSQEHRQSVIAKMMPPHNRRVSELSDETGISQQTLYNWRQKAREEGQVVPGDRKNSEQWSSVDKIAVVLETAAMNEAELSEYCCSKGLYPEQVTEWKPAVCKQMLQRRKSPKPIDCSQGRIRSGSKISSLN